MIALWLALAWAGGSQSVHELEWQRAPAAEIAAAARGGDAVVRADAARALGRLHREEAVALLAAMRSDVEPAVQVAVADALGGSPGGEVPLRDWLDQLPAPKGMAARAAAEEGVRARAIEALGRQGDASDLPRLTGYLAESWPTSAAAAEAIGRLGRRKVEGASAGLPALVDALSRPDPRTVEAAAYGVRRLGIEGASPEVITQLRAAYPSIARPAARAWIAAVLLPALELEARTDLYIAALVDPAPIVQVAALDAVGPDGVDVEIIAPSRLSTDGWVRQAAISALGRLGAVDVLAGFADRSEDPHEIAWAIASAGNPLGRDWRDGALDLRVRSAALEVADLEPQALIAIATSDVERALHTAAASALLSRDKPDPSWAAGLLGSPDSAVREAGLELLTHAEPAAQIAALLPHLRAERDLELLGTALAQFAALVKEDPTRVDPADPHLNNALRRATAARVARVRLAAAAVAEPLGIALPETREGPLTRELILPSGEVVEVAAGAPVLSQVRAIRGARVRTTRGEFTLALDPVTAPLAVHNFALLAERGFYDGVVFHRIVPGFVAQTGCPRGDGWGGPGWTLPDELSGEPYTTGSLGMARSTPWDTGGSQWFVATAPTPHLEGDYTRFGEVVQGMPVVRAMRLGDRVLSVEIERLAP